MRLRIALLGLGLAGGLLVLAATGCAAPQPAPATPPAAPPTQAEATATQAPPATAAPAPTAASVASAPQEAKEKPLASGCVTCHTNSKTLLSVASPPPTPVTSAEQQGEG